MIYVDLDNTLIDSAGRTEQEFAVAAKYGLSAEEFQNAINMVLKQHGISNYGYTVLYDACQKIRPGLDPSILADWWQIIDAKVFFPDSAFFLEQFAKEELTLLTTGSPDFQRAKIAAHGIAEMVGRILIVPSPKSAHIELPPDVSFYIDDSPRELDAMKVRHRHVVCIQVREPAPWEHQKASLHKDAHCPTLHDVLEFITTKKK